MDKISFLNGKFINHSQAFIHVEDRGFQLSDGVYEVILIHNNKLIDIDEHLERLFRSLREIKLKLKIREKEIKDIILKLVKKNNLSQGSVYLQVTRGFHPRTQIFPNNYNPTIFANVSLPKIENDQKAISTITHPDLRWARCDIKSISLLAGTLAKQHAFERGCDDAILVKNGFVTEGSFSNIFIVDQNNNLITRGADNQILNGVTRKRILSLAKKHDIKIIEKKFDEKELLSSKEVFLTSSTLKIRAVSEINGQKIGDIDNNLVTRKLIDLYNNWLLTS